MPLRYVNNKCITTPLALTSLGPLIFTLAPNGNRNRNYMPLPYANYNVLIVTMLLAVRHCGPISFIPAQQRTADTRNYHV